MPPFDLEALDEGAEHHPLGKRRQRRAIAEAVIPRGAVLGVLVAELEGDAAEDERQQHHQNGEIDRRDDDREGERKRRQQRQAAEHEPSLVAVPDRRDRVHRDAARGAIRRKAVEDADAEIEAVEQDIEEDGEPEDDRPHADEIENGLRHAISPIPPTAAL